MVPVEYDECFFSASYVSSLKMGRVQHMLRTESRMYFGNEKTGQPSVRFMKIYIRNFQNQETAIDVGHGFVYIRFGDIDSIICTHA